MRIKPEQTIALIIDEQERLLPVIHNHQEILHRTEILIKGLNLLNVPLILTQQYTKGLGMSAPSLFEAAQTTEWMEKRTFSCWGEETIRKTIQNSHRQKILICGVESHICVQQTVLDLLSTGYEVFLIVDCISSRKSSDLEFALQRMQQAGVVLTTSEAILFELMDTSLHPHFKEISKLIK